MEQTEPPPENRALLLERALQLFAARGYDAVGVQEVAEAAGVTKPTLYYYFHSKQGLLQSVLEAHFQPLEGALREHCEYRGDLTGTLGRVARALLRFAEANPLYYRLHLSLWFAPAESAAFALVSVLNRRLQDMLERLFRGAVKDHGNMRDRHQAYAASFLGLLNTYAALMMNGYVQLDEQLLRRVVHQFEHGIYS
jgi:AcrR family transcriptional regulator